MNSETKQCQNCRKSFVIEAQGFKFYEKMEVPAPTWCAECRLARRLTWRNERTLYKRVCDLCKREMVSIYHQGSPFRVYCPPCWWSDKWDSLELGQDYDFSKPFFIQFHELMTKVPRIGLIVKQSTGSEYTNYSFANNNTYLSFASHYNEDSAYLTYSTKCKDCFDGLHVSNSELAYECDYCDKIYQSSFLRYCFSCSECTLGYNLRNCQNCFGCVNLRNQQYHLFNKPYSKADYVQKISRYRESFEAFQEAKKLFNELKLKTVKPWSYQIKCVNCTGSDLEECGNIKNSFSAKFSEDSYNLYVNSVKVIDSRDVNNVGYDRSEFCYESEGITGSSNITFSSSSWHNSFISYCNLCFTSDHLFGCLGLRDKKYCILNKQYSKEEYGKILPKIIEHIDAVPYEDEKGRVYKYGEFFPPEFSPFAYNETIAQEHFPLTKEEALEKGYVWKEPEKRELKLTMTNEKLPDHIKDVQDSILNETIACQHEGTCLEQCTTAFRIIPQELQFYRQMNLPLPRLCPNCRHYQRVTARNPQKLWHSVCSCAGDVSENTVYQNTIEHFHKDKPCLHEFETSYRPERKEIIYCEPCYQAEVA